MLSRTLSSSPKSQRQHQSTTLPCHGFPISFFPSPPAPTPMHPLPPHQHPHPQYQAQPPSMPLPPGTPPKAIDLEVTVVSGKHLKNVNWCHEDLHAYAVAYLDHSHRAATGLDDAGGCKPSWNECIVLPLPPHLSPHDPSLLLSLDVFRSKPSDSPKLLVGSVWVVG